MAVVSTLLEEVALVAVWLWGLPALGVSLPLWILIVLMAAWGGYAIFAYRMGSRALRREPVTGLAAMVGSRGRVVSALAPEGLVRVGGELWRAVSTAGDIAVGEEVTVVGQDGLRLIVSPGAAEVV